MQNKLKPQTTGVIKVLAKASIRSVMITGTFFYLSLLIFINYILFFLFSFCRR